MRSPHLWFPYAQMETMAEPLAIKSAQGVKLTLEDNTILIDAISSWWCVIHGYNHPEITTAAKEQLDTLPHVMLGGLTHAPANDLADTLVSITPDGLNHVFFGDSGSVGVEIALKMAVQYHKNKGIQTKNHFIALKNSYHGDTCAVMSIADDDDSMHAKFQGFLPKQFFVSPPETSEAPINAALEELEYILTESADSIAAMIVEPLMQGAGGFRLHGADYLAAAQKLCHKHNVLMIYDEVATGFGRTGTLFAADQVSVTPDIMILGKGLSAGYLTLSATLATTEIYETFYGNPSNAFMHGPTYMGNPTACAIALKGIEVFKKDNYLDRIHAIESFLQRSLSTLVHDSIVDIRIKGAMACIEVIDPAALKGVQDFAQERGVWLRPFENYLYTCPAYIITDEELLKICSVMKGWFN
ncbi:MAG: adenosylmethionine--8-amino-7-oxononanoate transaminase [Fibrobacterales bacterium]